MAEMQTKLEQKPYLLTAGVIAAFSCIYLVNAFVCDDAFITFRTADNFANGFGLRYNIIERVQTFTNPLWLFLHVIPYKIFRDPAVPHDAELFYYLTLTVSYIFSGMTCLLVTKLVPQAALPTILAVLVLLSSKGFTDYTSSGLENPLTFFLIAIFFVTYLSGIRMADGVRTCKLTRICLIASLLVVNRIDAVLLICAPLTAICLSELWGRGFSAVRAMSVGFLPAILWFGFSIIYYGFPFPNTYYAKLGLELEPQLIFSKSLAYLFTLFRSEPYTFLILLWGVVAALSLKNFRLIGVSLVLYFVYLMKMGGDFMGGRFLGAPFLVSAIVLLSQAYANMNETIGRDIILTLSLISYNLIFPSSVLKAYDLPPGNNDKNIYYPASTPLHIHPVRHFPFTVFGVVEGRKECLNMESKESGVAIGGGGLHAFCQGPKMTLVDPLSLSDPLISRLPVPKDLDPLFVPAHFKKPIPKGLLKSYEEHRNSIEDRELRRYYQKIINVTQGPIFTWQRAKDIAYLNLVRPKYGRDYIAD